MNKTFKDPNTKYSDQGTPLAQSADALSELAETVDDLTETVDGLTETVDGLGSTVEGVSEKVDLFPVPVVADEGKVLTATDDGAYELSVPASELPSIGDSDAGKVLTVNSGHTGTEWSPVPSELPSIGDSDAGKVLTVNNSHTGVEWDAVESLPTIGSGDAGKVLTVNAGETGAEWSSPSGGIQLVAHYSASSSSTWASTDRRYNWSPSNSTINDENFVFCNYLFIVSPQTNNDFYSSTKPFFFAGVTTRPIGSNNYSWTASFERIYGEGITQTDISMKPSIYIYKLG